MKLKKTFLLLLLCMYLICGFCACEGASEAAKDTEWAADILIPGENPIVVNEPESMKNPESEATEAESTKQPESEATEPESTKRPESEATEPESTKRPESETTEPESAKQPESGNKKPESESKEKPEEPVRQPVVSAPDFRYQDVPAYSGKPYVTVNGNEPFFRKEEIVCQSYEYYAKLDSYGRCGVCMACIGKDLMPTEERGEIGEIKPTGWKQAKYEGIVDSTPPYLYNRCHLIAFCLTGENANEKNLITGTRYMNHEGMLPFEEKVANYIDRTANHVMYRVTPIFEGKNLLASGVLMEAYSVEDNGRGICFCVFCYNVQPGIAITYANGANQADGTIVPPGISETPAETVADDSSEAPVEKIYVVNARNGKIHKKGKCQATGTGKNAMKKPVYFETYEEAEEYSQKIDPELEARKCKNCW